MEILDFYKDKRILLTGHTGFKGSWMCTVLKQAGAQVTGYALEPPVLSLYNLCNINEGIQSVTGDVRDLRHLMEVFQQAKPEIVIHMAAQPIVRRSYVDPVYTYDVNVMGTVHVLECVRKTGSVRSFVNVTTDKVYKNREWEWGYRENEELNGFDPYSNSKSCSELVTDSYRNSFFADGKVAISTMRAGNVIGGGDFAADRIIPDCIRAAEAGNDIVIRNPYATRPYQHVMEPVIAYLMVAAEQYNDIKFAGSYNVGPDDTDCYTTAAIVSLFCKEWRNATGKEIKWLNRYDGGPHEAGFLKLDCSKLKNTFWWKPVWNMGTTMEKVVEWSVCYLQNGDVSACMDRQVRHYIDEMKMK